MRAAEESSVIGADPADELSLQLRSSASCRSPLRHVVQCLGDALRCRLASMLCCHCNRQAAHVFICVIVLVMLNFSSRLLSPTKLAWARPSRQANLEEFSGVRCADPEPAWCVLAAFYERNRDAPPVEIVFNNPRTWFNNVRISIFQYRTYSSTLFTGKLR